MARQEKSRPSTLRLAVASSRTMLFLLVWNALLLVVSAGNARNYFVDDTQYIPLHHTDLVPSFSTSMSRLWNNRKDIEAGVKHLVEDGTSRRGNNNNLLQKSWCRVWSPKKASFLDKTARAANAASKTVSKVAVAALESPDTDGSSSSTHSDARPVDFSHFGSSDVVSIRTDFLSKDPREQTILFARLKRAKKKERRALKKREKTHVTTVVEEETTSSGLSKSLLSKLADPLIPQTVWDKLTGKEFPENMELLEAFAKMGLEMASQDESNPWVAWNKVGSSFKETLEEGAIHVWTGQAQLRGLEEGQAYHGATAPFIKTRSIVPMTPSELIDLMLDSSRVKTYNQWSTGRVDLWTSADERTKIVQNTNSVPMSSKPLRSTTLLHACPVGSAQVINEETSWLMLSRAIGPQPQDNTITTSDILLGVNLVQPTGDGSSILTAITHVYSTAVPGMLAERLGVKSAIKFVKDLRALKEPVGA